MSRAQARDPETPEATEASAAKKAKKIALLDEARALTGIVRNGWIALLGGCLYTWLTLGSLQDQELFLLGQSVALPIAGTEVSTRGFFIFAPLLLLVLGSYVYIMFAQLLECYGRLLRLSRSEDNMLDGLPIDERVEPWFLTILIKRDFQPLDWLRRLFAGLLLWWVGPFTIFALGYRYLRAGDLGLSLTHGLVIIVGFFLAAYIREHAISHLQMPERRERPKGRFFARLDMKVIALAVGGYFALVLTGIHGPADMAVRIPPSLGFLSPHARLYGAELSAHPEDWDEEQWQSLLTDIDTIENCFPQPIDPATLAACVKDDAVGGPEPISRDALVLLLAERDSRIRKAIGARLGHEPAPQRVISFEASEETSSPYERNGDQTHNSFCSGPAAERVAKARNLRGADLRYAYLANANLVCATLSRADLRYADLTAAKLTDARLSGADLTQARLEAADLRFALLDGAVLRQADIDSATRLEGAVLDGVDFTDADLVGAGLGSTKIPQANLTRTDLRNATGTDATDLSNAVLDRTDLRGARLEGVDFRGSVIIGAKAAAASFREAQFDHAMIDAAIVDRTTSFALADFTGAALRSIDLGPTDITQEQVTKVFGDASTILPEGMDRPVFWPDRKLDDTEFYGRWLGWRTHCRLEMKPRSAVRRWLSENAFIEEKPWTGGTTTEACRT